MEEKELPVNLGFILQTAMIYSNTNHAKYLAGGLQSGVTASLIGGGKK